MSTHHFEVRLMMESNDRSEKTLAEALAAEIKKVMEQWDVPDSPERGQFEEDRIEYEERAAIIAEAAAATEQLAAEDFAFRINATK